MRYTPNPPTNIPTKIAGLKLSRKFPMGLGIPLLEIKIMLESNPLKSTMLVGTFVFATELLRVGECWDVSRKIGHILYVSPLFLRCRRRPRLCDALGAAGRARRRGDQRIFYLRNWLGWLETRLAQITLNYMKIVSSCFVAQGDLSYVKVT